MSFLGFDPYTHGDPKVVANAAVWTMILVSAILLGLRLYCRGVRIRRMWWDDYLLTIGWFFAVADACIFSVMLGLGYAVTNLTEGAIPNLTVIADNMHKFALGCTKTSFALTLLRVITTGWPRWLIIFLMITMNCQLLIHVILAWRQLCGEDVGIQGSRYGPTCMTAEDGVNLNIVGAFYSAFCDFALAMLPWNLVWGLQMKPAEKIGTGIAMSFGILAGISSIMKGVESIKINQFTSPDFLYHIWAFQIWNVAEPTATIVAASIPILRVLIRNMRSKGLSGSPATGGYIKSNTNSKFHASENVSERLDATDNSSDRSILGPITGQSQITRTTQVSVSYDARSDRSLPGHGEEFEMADHWSKNKRGSP